MTDWKALCRELVTAVESNCKEHIISHDLNCAYMKADAALAQPEPEGPTDEEIEREAIANADTDDEYRAFKNGAFFVQEHMNRLALARWGK